jgi:hypothetical protein
MNFFTLSNLTLFFVYRTTSFCLIMSESTPVGQANTAYLESLRCGMSEAQALEVYYAVFASAALADLDAGLDARFGALLKAAEEADADTSPRKRPR